MSENPTPSQTPAPTSTTTAPGTVKVTGIERTGTGLTVAGVVAAAIPLLYLAFASNIKLDTLGSINSLATTGLVITIIAAVIGLVATGLNIPGLGKPRVGPGVSTFFSGAALLTMALFLFVTVLPRISALSNLNDKVVPFAKSLNANCKKPLGAIGSDYQKVQGDAKPLATTLAGVATGDNAPPAPADLVAFAQTMTADVAIFQKDATNFKTYQANLNKLSSPDSKYNDLLSNCKKDVAGDLAFLSSNGIPTADFIAEINAGIDAAKQPADVTAVLKAVVASAIPASYNAQTLLQASAQATTGQFAFTLPAGIPAAQQPVLTLTLINVFGAAFPPFVSAAMGAASTATDITLTNQGNQLIQDIKDTLTNNLAPFTVDADKIVDDASK